MALVDSIADTIRDIGRAKAQGLVNQGQITGSLLGTLGQLPGQVIGLSQQFERQQQDEQRRKLELQQAQNEQRAQQALDEAMKFSLNPDGTFNRQNLQQAVTEKGIGHLWPNLSRTLDEAEAAQTRASLAKQQMDDANQEYAARLAAGVKAANYDPGALMPAVSHAVATKRLDPQTGQQLMLKAIEGGPEAIRPLVDQLIANSPKVSEELRKQAHDAKLAAQAAARDEAAANKPVVVAPGSLLVNPSTGETIATGQDKTRPPAAVGSFEDYVQRTYGEAPTPDQILAARKAYGQADDRPRVNVSVAGGEGLTPDAVDYTATAYRMLGTRAIPTRISGGDRAKILNKAAEQSKALGQSPAAAVTRQLTTKADSAALTKIEQMATSAEAFETKAIAQTEIISDLSKKVSRTQFPIINAALQAGRTNITGDANATKLANAIETFSEEYAKIMNGSTGSVAAASDSSRAAAKRLINTAMNQGTMQSVLDLMKKEMALTIQGYNVAREHITDRLGGAPATSAPVAPAAPSGGGLPSYQDYLKSKGK